MAERLCPHGKTLRLTAIGSGNEMAKTQKSHSPVWGMALYVNQHVFTIEALMDGRAIHKG